MAKSARTTSGKGGRRPTPPSQPGGSGNVVANLARFSRESYQEMRKVQWPTRAQIAQGTMVVVFVTAIFGIYLAVVDRIVIAIITHIDKWLT